MAYSDFTLPTALQKLSLRLHDRNDLFHDLTPVDQGPMLPAILADNIPLATAIHTEKARSEMIVVPILLEAWRQNGRRASLFSGIPFDVDPAQGLNGVCDFLMSKSSSQFVLGPPVLAVVEAKNDSIQAGLGQCVAEMVAAQIYNARQPDVAPLDSSSMIFGAVTTGSLWRFLRLRGSELEIDRTEYSLESVGKILAIVIECLTDTSAVPTASIAGDA